MARLKAAGRLEGTSSRLGYVRYLDDFPAIQINNRWDDVGASFMADKVYVVQTSQSVIQRALLLCTDPGDLILDPTCGSGTTAYVAEQWGRRWITIDTSRVALALARARIMGARYPYYLLADSTEGQRKEAEITRTIPSDKPTRGDIRQGFVYERVPHITLKSIANNAEIDVIWERFQETLEPLRASLNAALGKSWEEWEIPRDAGEDWPPEVKDLHGRWWEARIARQREIDASIAAKADFEYLYDKPYQDKDRVRVAGHFTVESLSPHRMLPVDEHDELIIDRFDRIEDRPSGNEEMDFAQMVLEHLKTAGVQQAHKEDRIAFSSIVGWPGDYICAEGRYLEGAAGDGGIERRAGIFVGPEFGTVSRTDLVAAAREAADAGFHVLIACAFNYDAHSAEFERLGRIPVLKARMNPELHMAGELKNTGAGNLFVVFGEPDIAVASGQWLVTSNGRLLANYEHVKELSGLDSLDEINRAGRTGLSSLRKASGRGAVRADQSDAAGLGVGGREHRRRGGAGGDEGVSTVLGDRERLLGGNGNPADHRDQAGTGAGGGHRTGAGGGRQRWSAAQRTQALAALQDLTDGDFPLTLTTDHWTQVTIHGVDVFHPQTGEVRSDGPDGIACWFIDTEYNEESFFVRHAYFLGASDPYKSLKTTLKAEIDEEAWSSLYSDTSRPFDKPSTGRIAVKVINHLGDEVMKVFAV